MAILMLATILSGCATVGPDYLPPNADVPDHWNSAVPGGGAGSEDLSAWWERLNDPLLTSLVERALKGNKDLKSAVEKVRESRARLGVSKAARYPTLDGSGSARFIESKTKSGGVTTGRDSETYSGGIDASWEIDLFGGTRRAVEAARADLGAQKEAMRGVRVSLAAEVALTYINIRELQQRIAITEDTLAVLRDEDELVKIRRDAGLVSDLDVAQSAENLASTEAQLPALRGSLNSAMNGMAILLGEKPGSLHAELSASGPIPSVPEGIAAGVPADLVRRRPDVRQAERKLAAETARVGVAVSELYPKLSLTGSFSYERAYSDTGDTSLLTKTRSAGFGPSLRIPIFSGGAIRRSIEAQDSRQEQALIAYEQAVLQALGEVENALVSYAQADDEEQLLKRAVDAASETESLRSTLYFSGIGDYVNLLSAKRDLLSLQNRLVATEASRSSNLVNIYKALGGGWNSEQEPAASAEKTAGE